MSSWPLLVLLAAVLVQARPGDDGVVVNEDDGDTAGVDALRKYLEELTPSRGRPRSLEEDLIGRLDRAASNTTVPDTTSSEKPSPDTTPRSTGRARCGFRGWGWRGGWRGPWRRPFGYGAMAFPVVVG